MHFDSIHNIPDHIIRNWNNKPNRRILQSLTFCSCIYCHAIARKNVIYCNVKVKIFMMILENLAYCNVELISKYN